jgi:thioredoxin reductase (NADPH)
MNKASKNFDLIIVGGGASGLTAGIYAARAGLRTMLLEKWLIGGLAATTDLIENYPGFPEGISGKDLMERCSKSKQKRRITGLMQSLQPWEQFQRN